MKLKKAFERKETKYTMDEPTFRAFQAELAERLQVDEYGMHTIMSLYFDTPGFQMIRHSMEKPAYKEKFRIRSYGVPTMADTVFLESKKKIAGIVYKRRIPVKYQTCCEWLAGTGNFPGNTEAPQITRELQWLLAQYPQIAPQVMIAYDRLSYFYEADPGFRVTFDQRIRYRRENLDLQAGSAGSPVAPETAVLMEVKALGAYPLWFAQLLTKYRLHKSSFSKFALTYRRHLANQQAPIDRLKAEKGTAGSVFAETGFTAGTKTAAGSRRASYVRSSRTV